MRKGQNLYIKAKKIIPGGNQLLSKRPEMFLPNQWPSYYSKAKGVKIWDLDSREYIDMSIMGIGTCSLGYSNSMINDAVKSGINKGSFSTLNSFEEVDLAERLIELHPHMDMVRFCRSGGEANAIAVRIARAASRKTRVAVCGYHGWHDWYLATNIGNDNNLDGLLLPGLSPSGVPSELKSTCIPFHYGNILELEKIIDKYKDLGVICIEVQRGKSPNLEFLSAVRKIANKINAVLIFDEISSGFRLTVGGVYKKYNLEPDMIVLGKALGNGFGISAVLGKREIMDNAQNTFISSSYWTERTPYVAALATLKQFQEKKVIDHITYIGTYFREKLTGTLSEINVMIEGMISVPILIFQGENSLALKTLFTQEMLKRGYIASNVIYLSLAHNKKIIDKYFENVEEVVQEIKELKNEDAILECLNGPVSHSGFRRLT